MTFEFRKKQKKNGSCSKTQLNTTKIENIKILGSGCKSCHEQYENVKKALSEHADIPIEYITDMEKVMSYGAMSMPAIVINEKLVSMGKVLKPCEVIRLLERI